LLRSIQAGVLFAENQRSILGLPAQKEKDDVMRIFTSLIIVSILMMVATPAWTDEAMHIVLCEQGDGVTDDQVEQMATKWFAAAKGVKGGENLVMRLNFPVAAKAGEIDVAMMLLTPNFSEWGAFMDNYPNSPAEDVDDEFEEFLDCGDGSLWESVAVK